jgi:hypothetical protein
MSNSPEDHCLQATRHLNAHPEPASLKDRDNLNLPASFNDHIFPLRPYLIVQQQLEHHFALGLVS